MDFRKLVRFDLSTEENIDLILKRLRHRMACYSRVMREMETQLADLQQKIQGKTSEAVPAYVQVVDAIEADDLEQAVEIALKTSPEARALMTHLPAPDDQLNGNRRFSEWLRTTLANHEDTTRAKRLTGRLFAPGLDRQVVADIVGMDIEAMGYLDNRLDVEPSDKELKNPFEVLSVFILERNRPNPGPGAWLRGRAEDTRKAFLEDLLKSAEMLEGMGRNKATIRLGQLTAVVPSLSKNLGREVLAIRAMRQAFATLDTEKPETFTAFWSSSILSALTVGERADHLLRPGTERRSVLAEIMDKMPAGPTKTKTLQSMLKASFGDDEVTAFKVLLEATAREEGLARQEMQTLMGVLYAGQIPLGGFLRRPDSLVGLRLSPIGLENNGVTMLLPGAKLPFGEEHVELSRPASLLLLSHLKETCGFIEIKDGELLNPNHIGAIEWSRGELHKETRFCFRGSDHTTEKYGLELTTDQETDLKRTIESLPQFMTIVPSAVSEIIRTINTAHLVFMEYSEGARELKWGLVGGRKGHVSDEVVMTGEVADALMDHVGSLPGAMRLTKPTIFMKNHVSRIDYDAEKSRLMVWQSPKGPIFEVPETSFDARLTLKHHAQKDQFLQIDPDSILNPAGIVALSISPELGYLRGHWAHGYQALEADLFRGEEDGQDLGIDRLRQALKTHPNFLNLGEREHRDDLDYEHWVNLAYVRKAWFDQNNGRLFLDYYTGKKGSEVESYPLAPEQAEAFLAEMKTRLSAIELGWELYNPHLVQGFKISSDKEMAMLEGARSRPQNYDGDQATQFAAAFRRKLRRPPAGVAQLLSDPVARDRALRDARNYYGDISAYQGGMGVGDAVIYWLVLSNAMDGGHDMATDPGLTPQPDDWGGLGQASEPMFAPDLMSGASGDSGFDHNVFGQTMDDVPTGIDHDFDSGSSGDGGSSWDDHGSDYGGGDFGGGDGGGFDKAPLGETARIDEADKVWASAADLMNEAEVARFLGEDDDIWQLENDWPFLDREDRLKAIAPILTHLFAIYGLEEPEIRMVCEPPRHGLEGPEIRHAHLDESGRVVTLNIHDDARLMSTLQETIYMLCHEAVHAGEIATEHDIKAHPDAFARDPERIGKAAAIQAFSHKKADGVENSYESNFAERRARAGAARIMLLAGFEYDLAAEPEEQIRVQHIAAKAVNNGGPTWH